mgnify:CR=1 FL=1
MLNRELVVGDIFAAANVSPGDVEAVEDSGQGRKVGQRLDMFLDNTVTGFAFLRDGCAGQRRILEAELPAELDPDEAEVGGDEDWPTGGIPDFALEDAGLPGIFDGVVKKVIGAEGGVDHGDIDVLAEAGAFAHPECGKDGHHAMQTGMGIGG